MGDGDFGYSLARGFERLIEKWDGLPRDSCSDFLQAVAMCLSTRIGGTSGPIWGTAFLRAATSLRDKPDPGTSDIVALRRQDIAWEEGTVAVTGKGRRQILLPLTQEVGDALLHYLEHARPRVVSDRLFLRVKAPAGPLTQASRAPSVSPAPRRSSRGRDYVLCGGPAWTT